MLETELERLDFNLLNMSILKCQKKFREFSQKSAAAFVDDLERAVTETDLQVCFIVQSSLF